jgi:hypothetical protein
MEVIDDHHNRGSALVAIQILQDGWHPRIGDPMYADAILDCLVNNAYRLEFKGRSMHGGGARRVVADPAVDEIGTPWIGADHPAAGRADAGRGSRLTYGVTAVASRGADKRDRS